MNLRALCRWLITHCLALRRFPSEEGASYQERLAFEKGAWDGEHWDDSESLEEYSPDVNPGDWETWRISFSVTAGF